MIVSSKSFLVFLAAAATVQDVASFTAMPSKSVSPELFMSSFEQGSFAVGNSDVGLSQPSISAPPPPEQAGLAAPPPPESAATDAPPATGTTTTRVQWMPEGGIPMYVERDRLTEKRQVIIDTVATPKGEESSKISLFESDGGMMLQQNAIIQGRLVRNELPDVEEEEETVHKIPLFVSDGGMMLQQNAIIRQPSRLVYADGPDTVEEKTKPFTTFQLESNDMMYVSRYQTVPKEQVRYTTDAVAAAQQLINESAPVTTNIPSSSVDPRLMLTQKVVDECETRGQHFAKFYRKGIMMEQSTKETKFVVQDPSIIDTTASSPSSGTASLPEGQEATSMPDQSAGVGVVERDIDFVAASQSV
mmetsp:Transcript_54432/g.132103  ORF Transcript_54432/g.132103 Transcript_54432/m.132103 type:complete len:360 (-) Transcript_54432:343-1422(-)